MTHDQQISLWHTVTSTSFKHWLDRGYTYVEVPSTVRASGACEFVDSLLEVAMDSSTQWASQPVFLKQTGQLHLEGAISSFNKTFTIGRSFRAEKHLPSDGRHCMEFSLHEIEFSGQPDALYDQLLDEINGFVNAQKQAVLDHADEVGLSLEQAARLRVWPKKFARLTYAQAIEQLQAAGQDIHWGDDFTHQQELWLAEHNGPVFLLKFPDPSFPHPELEGRELQIIKFFNMWPDGEGNINSADLILPGAGESVGAAVRVHDVKVLKERLGNSIMFGMLVKRRLEWLVKKGLAADPKAAEASVWGDFQWYIDAVAAKGVPHAGCGFGMNRVVQSLMGATMIEDIDAFPVTYAGFASTQN
jgi:aspartyl/asparaginyl-tRNA synthetase